MLRFKIYEARHVLDMMGYVIRVIVRCSAVQYPTTHERVIFFQREGRKRETEDGRGMGGEH